MVVVRLKGLNKVRKRRADGSEAIYWYAWKGGPRLDGTPGTPEFLASYNAAIADRKAPRNDTLSGLIILYKSKPEFADLEASTKREWARWLDRISVGQLERPATAKRAADPKKWGLGKIGLRDLESPRIRVDLMDWRDQWSDRPRAADYGVQVLSRVLGFAVERGILSINRAEGIPHLYEANRADLIWEPSTLASFCAKAPAPVSQALRLACLTGLRRGDLVRLQWRHVSDIAIELPTNKSRRKGVARKVALIPLLAEARALLAEIGRRAEFEPVLRNAHGRGWGVGSLSHRIAAFAEPLGIGRSLHDARGTFATRLRLAGLTSEEIAEILGWEKERVERILAKYVDRERIVRALVRKVEQNEAGS